MEGIGWGWLGIGALHMLVFWGLVILALVALFRWGGDGPGDESRSVDILKTRYAKGELTREQFEQMKRELKDD